MKISGITGAEKRRDKRSTARPLDVAFDGLRLTASEWSLSGFRIVGYRGEREPGDRLDVKLHFGTEDDAVSRPMKIEIVRVNGAAEALAARFVHLDDTTYDMLEAWVSGARRRVLQLAGRSA